MTRPKDSSRDSSKDPSPQAQDPVFQQQVMRLHQLTVYSRWLFVIFLWVIVAPLCLWHLRSEIALWLDYFTWTAVRYTIIFNRLATIGLILCIAWTVSTLLWQTNYLWRGIPDEERRSLERQVLRIQRKGKRHFLWKWVCKPR
jgi:hypothetical protein